MNIGNSEESQRANLLADPDPPTTAVRRVAFIVSHPIQYYAPLHQRLARRSDLELKVFFTWHAGEAPVLDQGFKAAFSWDIPLTEGYQFERVPNVASDPGTHHFFGLRNPDLVDRVMAWKPDLAVVHGWAWLSHLQALRTLHRRHIPTLFRGDSHLLDGAGHGPRWWLKRSVLKRVFGWPEGFLVVGSANRAYYEAFGVDAARLHPCPHSIDVARFAASADAREQEAARWRQDLGIPQGSAVLLYAGKFEPKKRPLELMQVVRQIRRRDVVLVLIGGGELQREIDAIAAADPARFRVLPFQNQTRMPVAYRLADLFVLPSAHDETWGLAVNEALACDRPVLVSDRVGCAADVVEPGSGRVFPWRDLAAMQEIIEELTVNLVTLARLRPAAAERARGFDIGVTEETLVNAVRRVCTG